MNSNFTDIQKQLKVKLSVSVRLSKRKRVVRLITHPWKMLYPKFLKIARRSKEVKVRTFFGEEMSVVLPEDVSTNIWRYGSFEGDVCLFMLNSLQKGMTFIDIGAHYGFFTLLGSYLVGKEGKVLAFEPTPTTYQQLLKNVTNHSKYPNVETYNCAAYSEGTEIEFYDYGLENSAYNSAFGSRKADSSSTGKNTIIVKARRIDDILREKELKSANLIKIDAESSEMHVLKGMIKTLRNYEPNIIIELGDFEIHGVPESKEIITWLQHVNYSPYEVRNGEIVPHVIRAQYEYSNLLFVAK